MIPDQVNHIREREKQGPRISRAIMVRGWKRVEEE